MPRPKPQPCWLDRAYRGENIPTLNWVAVSGERVSAGRVWRREGHLVVFYSGVLSLVNINWFLREIWCSERFCSEYWNLERLGFHLVTSDLSELMFYPAQMYLLLLQNLYLGYFEKIYSGLSSLAKVILSIKLSLGSSLAYTRLREMTMHDVCQSNIPCKII